jgi:quercetin dioxygenase-like cupin family protein
MSCATCPVQCGFGRLPDALQPFGEDFQTADGVFIKQMVIPRSGTIVPQHSHVYDHTTMLAKGILKVEVAGELAVVHYAPAAIFIRAGVKHLLTSLEDDTIAYCIHNVSRNGSVEVQEEHQITE